ncbi:MULTISPECIES: flagellar biosynthetic protein FliO [Pseudoxanthomonas]|uniref:Flagellar protein n=1 Tax=Pseudoxanthomonas winnipegensis TaxID=2480810 RepID=A0AAW8GCF6_9GAMM|nr:MULTISPECIES: flagellar biosynthetic protein FliO [Pseudoxanthomonas]MDQ1120156.1 flagellar protein FliO/FliZ [Pseudoxanthomonas winnipegensis]MDQ1133367.1 flagellar protein FliO/FliZ [Pseudoxanthomonas winnipegensis]MDR6140387.1 flagellar protein FliO/FliZ [Pseudoxanthomonas sp. SORGH_AS_0997]WJI16394.1 flagellar biosynthetic protein FliO [Pseudoxanthomonas winnipegensis]
MSTAASASASLAAPDAVVAPADTLPATAAASPQIDGHAPTSTAPAAATSVPASTAPATTDQASAAALPTNVEAEAAAASTAQPAKQFTVPGRLAAQATTTQLGAPVGAPASGTGAGSIGGAVLALVLVVGLILLLGWLAKRMPGIGGASNPALKVVGSLSLSPRERVVVVAVGDTQLVLGTGAGGTRVLHQLDTPLPLPQHKAPPAFAQVLAQHFGKKS